MESNPRPSGYRAVPQFHLGVSIISNNSIIADFKFEFLIFRAEGESNSVEVHTHMLFKFCVHINNLGYKNLHYRQCLFMTSQIRMFVQEIILFFLRYS
jgi:hypothetical protein